MSEEVLERGRTSFKRLLNDLREATSISKESKSRQLLSQIDRLMRKQDGVDYIYSEIQDLVEAGVFKDSVWDNLDKLVPKLVSGTLKAGTPLTDYELLSELRILAISEGKLKSDVFSPDQATDFLETVIVDNLDLIYGQLNEDQRIKIQSSDLKKIQRVFKFILNHLSVEGIKKQLEEELVSLTQQRPVFTGHIRDIIQLIKDSLSLDPENVEDQKLLVFYNSTEGPSELALKSNTANAYKEKLNSISASELEKEAIAFGESMDNTGLVSTYHVLLVKFLKDNEHHKWLKTALALNKIGKAELDEHQSFVYKLIDDYLETYYCQGVYGLSSMLNRSLFSRSAVKNAFRYLLNVDIHPVISKRLVKSAPPSSQNPDANILLAGGTMNILGQPLGVGQGMNPTCQSARGISLWSDHAPTKLINMIISIAESNNLEMRFEGKEIRSIDLIEGLTQEFDYKLDPLSVVIVPHLDKIYNEMMKRASLRTDDPHKWVNPAFYGHWIPMGFESAYNYLMQSIHQYDEFVGKFYAAFHPQFNGNRKVAYPIPIGLFITSANAEMLGFHAVSLLRVAKDQEGITRIYFLNPNSEGRQDWGQDIVPTVNGNGEEAGESSLPFDEFTSRVYAYHYIPTGVEDRIGDIPVDIKQKVTKLAKESWGKKYIWT